MKLSWLLDGMALEQHQAHQSVSYAKIVKKKYNHALQYQHIEVYLTTMIFSSFNLPKDSPQPFPLFDMPEPDESGKLVKDINLPALSRKKQGRKALPDNLLRREILHDIDEEDKVCEGGCTLNRIGEEVS